MLPRPTYSWATAGGLSPWVGTFQFLVLTLPLGCAEFGLLSVFRMNIPRPSLTPGGHTLLILFLFYIPKPTEGVLVLK